ncbi:hypothetical protein [Oxalicibacterium solurbis]|uniref:Uncharacterized protein n=1 Tax=Oxalicibacterium solurbis TaxID=69280 RepID=A0A8J3F4F2_9BURK|nr:hypothetical protein [Oxalicibacterium solurbis]GGI54467.1 hypothetical protein GCM10011430_16410 [Oxalicibacterium solurbis]
MKEIAEFRVKSPSGKEIILEQDGKGVTYLDYGSTKLPRDFTGYRIKDTDRIAEDLGGGKFKLKGDGEVYSRP